MDVGWGLERGHLLAQLTRELRSWPGLKILHSALASFSAGTQVTGPGSLHLPCLLPAEGSCWQTAGNCGELLGGLPSRRSSAGSVTGGSVTGGSVTGSSARQVANLHALVLAHPWRVPNGHRQR